MSLAQSYKWLVLRVRELGDCANSANNFRPENPLSQGIYAKAPPDFPWNRCTGAVVLEPLWLVVQSHTTNPGAKHGINLTA